MPVNPADFDKHSDKLMERYGSDLIRRGSEFSKVFTIPTGSHEFDWAMYGGVPIGRRTRLVGDEHTGKTHLIWCVIRNAQNIHHIYKERYARLIKEAETAKDKELLKELRDDIDIFLERFPDGMECAYYNVEKQFHKDYVASKGVDVDRLRIVDSSVIETIGATCESLMGSIHLHAIDSTSSAISVRELTAEAEDEHRGVDASRWGAMFKRIEERFDSEENTLMYVSHVYYSQGGGRPVEVAKGGRRLGYSSDMTVGFRRPAWLYRDKNGMLTDKDQAINTISGLKEPDGVEMVIRIGKSRVSPPFRTARSRIGFGDANFDTLYELSQAAKYFGVVQQAGGWIYLLDEDGERGDDKFHGEAKWREHLREDAELREHILKLMREDGTSRAGAVEDMPELEEDDE